MKELRKIIRNAILEVKELPHFKERIRERLYNPENIQPALDPRLFEPALDLVRKVNFPGQANVGINIYRSGVTYRAYVSDKSTPTEGNNIWVIVRGNELENVIFTRDNGVPQNTQFQLTASKLNSIVRERGYDLTYADLDGKTLQPKDTRKRGPDIDLPIVTIRGQKWYVDSDGSKFIYAKNINKVMTFDDAFNTLPEDELNAVLDQLPKAA